MGRSKKGRKALFVWLEIDNKLHGKYPMINVLIDYAVDLQFLSNIPAIKNQKICSDIEEFQSCSGPCLALLWYESRDVFLHRFEIAVARSDLTVIFSREMLDPVFLRRIKGHDRVWIISPVIDSDSMIAAKSTCWMYWIDSVRRCNDHRDPILADSDAKMFDVLLGSQRYHRDVVFRALRYSELRNQSLLSYFASKDPQIPRWIGISGPEVPWDRSGQGHVTVGEIIHNDIKAPLSCFIDKGIYQQSRYSLVTETQYLGTQSFFTEKIAKPLLTGRLFLVVANRHYLRHLRSLHFRTFDGIVDESYDDIENDTDRYQAVIKQAHLLAQKDPKEVSDLIAPIVKHNHRLASATDWRKRALEQLNRVILRQFDIT